MFLSATVIVALYGCQPVGGSLNEEEIRDFVTTHFAEKVGLDDAVEPFLEDLSDDTRVMNAMWGTASDYDKSTVKGEWFYEDSVTSEIYDINIEGSSATVMGSTSDYIAGLRS